MAEAGSGVPEGCLYAEKPEDEAEVGLLFLPSTIAKLSDLECPLPSLPPLAELLMCVWGRGRFVEGRDWSDGVALLPIGVASRSCGGAGLVKGREIWEIGGSEGAASLELFVTDFWPGEGGIAKPSRGARGPEFLGVLPGIGGRRRGAGDASGGS